MSRIKRKRLLSLVLMAFVLTSAPVWAQEDILMAGQLEPEQINYRTETVTRGQIIRTVNAQASEYYPLIYPIRFDGADAKFLEYTVARGDEVKAGDVLARFVITGSEVELTRMELNLKRLREDTELGIAQREEAIRKARAELAAVTDKYQKERGQLALRRMETELEQYRYRQEYSMAQQQETLDKEKARLANNVLISPVNGIVDKLTYKKVDDAVSASEVLITISSTEVMLLRLDNSSANKLRYNMPVTVSTGSNKQRFELTGRVVAADDIIDESERTGHAFVLLDPYDEEKVKLRNSLVTGTIMLLEDVLVAPRSVITLESGKFYVNKLNDGMVQKRYVQAAIIQPSGVWFLADAEEGDTLIVD